MNPNLSPQQFYHGTDAELHVGDSLDPGRMRSWAKKIGRTDTDYAFATSKPKLAAEYGDHVYTVEPSGPVERDPNSQRGSIRSTAPMKVTGAVMTSMWDVKDNDTRSMTQLLAGPK